MASINEQPACQAVHAIGRMAFQRRDAAYLVLNKTTGRIEYQAMRRRRVRSASASPRHCRSEQVLRRPQHAPEQAAIVLFDERAGMIPRIIVFWWLAQRC